VRSPGSVGLSELRELLTKCWMTHDAMWFLFCTHECGIEKANQINKAAVNSMARIEVKRLMKFFEVERIDTFETLRQFLEAAQVVVKPDFMKFHTSFPRENLLRWDMLECFAFEGVKKIGAIDVYECGIFERVQGWFEGMGVEYTVSPKVEGCMMHQKGVCFREFDFHFG
jgi:hypothetical protein